MLLKSFLFLRKQLDSCSFNTLTQWNKRTVGQWIVLSVQIYINELNSFKASNNKVRTPLSCKNTFNQSIVISTFCRNYQRKLSFCHIVEYCVGVSQQPSRQNLVCSIFVYCVKMWFISWWSRWKISMPLNANKTKNAIKEH